jgi:hypothetical protein
MKYGCNLDRFFLMIAFFWGRADTQQTGCFWQRNVPWSAANRVRPLAAHSPRTERSPGHLRAYPGLAGAEGGEPRALCFSVRQKQEELSRLAVTAVVSGIAGQSGKGSTPGAPFAIRPAGRAGRTHRKQEQALEREEQGCVALQLQSAPP